MSELTIKCVIGFGGFVRNLADQLFLSMKLIIIDNIGFGLLYF